MDKKNLVIISLIIVIIIGILCIAIPRYNLWQQSKGYRIGFQETLALIFQQAATCQQIPLTINNQTVNIIALECLNQEG